MGQPARLQMAPRIAGALVLAALGVVMAADPAGAHGVGGIRPTNYETVITGARPQVRGIAVRVVDLGDRLELTNRTAGDVVLHGYDGEPYLRVGPRGAFENARSPATYVNRTRRGTTPVPASADPDAPAEWRRIGDEPVVRWHDHRAHWNARRDPPSVRADPGTPHVVQRFRIELGDGERLIAVRGEVRWVPAPSAWLWVALALVLAAFVVALSRTAFARAALSVTLILVIVSETLHVVGAWGATTLATGTRLGASVYALGAIAVAFVALVWLWGPRRRAASTVVAGEGVPRDADQWGRVHAAAPLVLLAGLFVAIAGGLADVSVLTRSQVPTTLPYDVARTTVAAALGLGVGLVVAGALRLRPERGGRQSARATSWPSTQSWHSSSSVA